MPIKSIDVVRPIYLGVLVLEFVFNDFESASFPTDKMKPP